MMVADFSTHMLAVYRRTPQAKQRRVITIAKTCAACWPLKGTNVELQVRRAAFWTVLEQMLNGTGAATAKNFKALLALL